VTNVVGVTRLGHVNIVVPDYHAAIEHWRRLFDAEFFLFMHVPAVQAANTLCVVGDTCVELFWPWDADCMLGRTLARRGPGTFAFEFTVADYDRARQAIADRGLRITQEDSPSYFWVHPADLGGVVVEFSPALFHDDPRDAPGWSTDRWAKGPLGITGLRSVSVSLTQPAAQVAEQFGELFGARVTSSGSAGGRDFTEIEMAGDTYRLLSPPASGTAAPGVTSIDFAVSSLADVRTWAKTVGVPLAIVDSGRLALPREMNIGTRIEFVQC
jgi:hypothetical protein